MKTMIIGGGISGLSLACELIEQGLPHDDLVLLEKESTLGGKIQLMDAGEFIVEAGPNGFLDNKPEIMDFCNRMGLQDQLMTASELSKKRFVYKNSLLQQIPESPPALIKSRLLSMKAKIRLIGEMFVTAKTDNSDETVAAFARRRIGKEAADTLVDPMISGVFAGDPEKLSLKAAFPRMVEIETKYGSLIKGMIQIAKEKKAANAGKPSKGIGGNLTSFKSGLGFLSEHLRHKLGDIVQSDQEVIQLEKGVSSSWKVVTKKEHFEVDRLILAVPAYVAAELLASIQTEASALLKEIPYAGAAVIGLGYKRKDVSHDLNGFGFLIPSSEKEDILGCLWTSSIFPGERAPDKMVLLRTIAGGARNPKILELDEKELVKLTKESLKKMMGLEAEPVVSVVKKWEKAIPQYPIGHIERLEQIEQHLQSLPEFYLTGNAYRGISLADCVKNSGILAKSIMNNEG